jgi:hypothetical protein
MEVETDVALSAENRVGAGGDRDDELKESSSQRQNAGSSGQPLPSPSPPRPVKRRRGTQELAEES